MMNTNHIHGVLVDTPHASNKANAIIENLFRLVNNICPFLIEDNILLLWGVSSLYYVFMRFVK